MNLGRIFANAIARRVAYVLVAMVLAWLGLSDARAAVYADQGAAFAACKADEAVAMGHQSAVAPGASSCSTINAGGNIGGVPHMYYTCSVAQGAGNTYVYSCNMMGAGGDSTYHYPTAASCSGRPSQVTPFLPLTGSTQCWNGCVVSYAQNGDDETSTRSPTGAVCGPDFKEKCPTGYFWNGYMGVCQPIQPDCPAGQTRVDGQCKPENKCPDGMVAVQGSTPGAIQQGALYCKPADEECPPGNVKAPSGQCLPGEGQCAAGEARRPNGTCGRDSDGDGQADEDDDNPNNDPNKPSASGGDTCNAPPSCSGGPIDCMQVKIQWRIDCNTRKSRNISGGTCGAVPVCTGEKCDALEYNSLVMQWRTACAVEKLKPGTSQPGDGEKIKPDFEAFAGTSDGANPDDSIFLPDGDEEGFNQSLISYGAGALGWNFSVEGQQFALPQQITDFIAVLRWLIIAAATLVGIAIAWGRS